MKTARSSCALCMVTYALFVIGSFGLTAYCLYHYNFSYKYHNINGVGQVSLRHIGDSLNTILCSAYDVTPLVASDTILIHGKARVNRKRRSVSRRTTQQLELDSGVTNNAFYLLEESHIYVNACRHRGNYQVGEIVIIKGDKSYKKWKQGLCPHCPVRRRVIGQTYCEYGDNMHLKYTAREIDTYYIVMFQIENRPSGGFKAELKVSQTTYNTRNAIGECRESFDCHLKLPYSSDVDVVVRVGDGTSVSSLGSQCKLRSVFWVVVFVIAPGGLLALGLCCCCCMGGCSKQTTVKKTKATLSSEGVSTSSKANLCDNENPPDYGSVVAGHTSVQSI